MLLIDDLIAGTLISLKRKAPVWNTVQNKLKHSLIIWKGLFLTDHRLPFYQRVWFWFSRFSWELPQTILGVLTAMILNWSNRVNQVSHQYGATLIKLNGIFGGMCLPPIIIADEQVDGQASNHLFQHEFGHVVQSKIWGPLYLIRIGLPSLLSAINNDYDTHMRKWPEQDANKKAHRYFSKRNIPTYSWDYERNPILKG